MKRSYPLSLNLFRRPRSLVLALVQISLLSSVVAGLVAAHGGGEPQLTNAEAGPYRVSAWTEPDPIRAGQLHLTVAVSQAPEPGAVQGDVVLDAAVQVRLEPVGLAGEAVVAPATRENAVNKLLYEADMELPAEGRWHVTVEVVGPDGAGSAAFEIDALPSSTASGLSALPWSVWAGMVLVVLLAGGLVWARRPQPPRTFGGAGVRAAEQTAATAGRPADRRTRTADSRQRTVDGRR